MSASELADGKLKLDSPVTGVLRLTIANPAKRNALDHSILDAITRTLSTITSPVSHSASTGAASHMESTGAVSHMEIASPASGPREAPPALDAPVRCVIVTGSDGMFSAGYDIGEIPADEFERRAQELVAHPFTEAIEALEAFPYPTLAALGGHTIGGGLELALACDLRVAASEIKLGMPPAKLGLVYSHTGLRRFLETIGAARTRELFLLGRYIDASTALGWGLVNEVAPPEELQARSLRVAGELVANAPLSQLGNKRVIEALLDAGASLSGDVEAELIELRRASFASRDMREGIAAFAQKRPPRWEGR